MSARRSTSGRLSRACSTNPFRAVVSATRCSPSIVTEISPRSSSPPAASAAPAGSRPTTSCPKAVRGFPSAAAGVRQRIRGRRRVPRFLDGQSSTTAPAAAEAVARPSARARSAPARTSRASAGGVGIGRSRRAASPSWCGGVGEPRGSPATPRLARWSRTSRLSRPGQSRNDCRSGFVYGGRSSLRRLMAGGSTTHPDAPREWPAFA